jgi:predicted RNA-binding protein with PUA-like domain
LEGGKKRQTPNAKDQTSNVNYRKAMPINQVSYWLVKQEPEAYAWRDFVRDKGTAWTGIRNYQARNNLRAMKAGDLVLYYHSVSEKQVVGLARVAKEHYPDPTPKEGDWSAVDLVPVKGLAKPVSLEAIKADRVLCEMPLLKNTRLSVLPLTRAQFQRVLALAETKVKQAV